jgi:hypothetical protein
VPPGLHIFAYNNYQSSFAADVWLRLRIAEQKVTNTVIVSTC